LPLAWIFCRYTIRFYNLYEQLANGEHDGPQTADALRSIDVDLYKTFPKHGCLAAGTPQSEMGVTSLRRVLHAYAAFDRELGYCQRYKKEDEPLFIIELFEKANFSICMLGCLHQISMPAYSVFFTYSVLIRVA
jgi:hypothetical protein